MLSRVYRVFCKAEVWVAAALLVSIATLVFVSAISRTFGYPLNWAVDISLLLFAWLVFLGGDVVIREGYLIKVDLFFNRFPPPVRKALMVAFYVVMLMFLAALVYYGNILANANKKRQFQAMELSYYWCTLSVVVGSFLMGISTFIRLVKELRPTSGDQQEKADPGETA